MQTLLVSASLLAASLIGGCGGNLQENPVAVPVAVNRQVLGVDTFGVVPTVDNVENSTVLTRFSAPKAEEIIPDTAYNGNRLWYISSYAAASSMKECTEFLQDWARRLNPNWVKRGFCVVRSPQGRKKNSIASITEAKL